MDFYPRTIHQSGSWIRPTYLPLPQRILPSVNTGEALIYSAQPSTATSVPTYQYVQNAQSSAGRHWRETGNFCAHPQDMSSVLVNLPIPVPQMEQETSTFTGNFPLQPASVRSSQVALTRPPAVAPVRVEESLTFVGNFTHAPDVTQDQLIALLGSARGSGCAASHGVSSTQRILNPTLPRSSYSGNVKHAHPSTFGNVKMPAQELQSATTGHHDTAAGACGDTHSGSSAVHYTTREAYVKMLEYHRHMASYYKQLKLKAEHSSQLEGSVCPQLQRKRGGVSGGSWEEPPQKRCWDDGTGGIILPDDAIEKLDAIPGIWDLAIEMGFLTVLEEDK
ncbi:hypothetical protein AALO_G00210000 [Alosa alosa]|uniref:Uncharacterized protein n=1 Tax=Alosa alosa TaxID=278164 RepID=A0AAV6G3W1_9TELE|nr:uncharacterized protein LOC125309785 [Alosa alosa]KAG5268251.1 hypothetical protein AALO_G00210000 [Alosa alosa]